MRVSGTLLLLGTFLGSCTKPTPPAPAAANPVRIGDLIAIMSVQHDEHPGHGTYHRARNTLERELWTLSIALPTTENGDELLLHVVEQVYTRYDQNYLNGYLWHWPYLSSRRAITLTDRILSEYPRSRWRERALWLKAFALRCPPTQPDPQAEKDLDVYRDQLAWTQDTEKARAIYQHMAAMDGPYAAKAHRLAESPELGLILPVGPLEPDPRSAD